MVDDSRRESAATIMRQINRTWLDGRFTDLAPMLHPEIVMAFPAFARRIQGREDFIAGFRDFCENAKIHEFREPDYQVDVAGETAVVTFRYDMVYERSGARFRSTGWDLWVFQDRGNAWIAVWRTMLEMEESAA